ncbi:hypothetical protein KM043_006784 [Ampulex compressa]|nr:hypothetical protein KM043_006784 [Ampulex compressa]
MQSRTQLLAGAYWCREILAFALLQGDHFHGTYAREKSVIPRNVGTIVNERRRKAASAYKPRISRRLSFSPLSPHLEEGDHYSRSVRLARWKLLEKEELDRGRNWIVPLEKRGWSVGQLGGSVGGNAVGPVEFEALEARVGHGGEGKRG